MIIAVLLLFRLSRQAFVTKAELDFASAGAIIYGEDAEAAAAGQMIRHEVERPVSRSQPSAP